MRVSQVMSSPAITLDKNLSLSNAIDLMKKHDISRLVVLHAEHVVGVLTEKDIVRELGSTHTYRLPAGRMYISNLMTTNPITVASDLMAKRAAELMLNHNIGGLPVVEEGNLSGVITKMDFAKVCVSYDDVRVEQVMQTDPITISPSDRIIHARKLLLENDQLALPVMEGGKLVGVLTAWDVAMNLVAFQDVVPDRHKSERIRKLIVEDIMGQPATTVQIDSKLSEVAKRMHERRFSGFPVVSAEGELVGLLTKTELVEIACERL